MGCCQSGASDEKFIVPDDEHGTPADQAGGNGALKVTDDPFPTAEFKVKVERHNNSSGDEDESASLSSERRRELMDRYEKVTPQPSPSIGGDATPTGQDRIQAGGWAAAAAAMKKDEDEQKEETKEETVEIPKLDAPNEDVVNSSAAGGGSKPGKKKKSKKRKQWVIQELIITNLRVSREPKKVQLNREVSSTESILQLKRELLTQKEVLDIEKGLPSGLTDEEKLARMILVHKGRRTLKDEKTIKEYGIKNGHSLFMVLSTKKSGEQRSSTTKKTISADTLSATSVSGSAPTASSSADAGGASATGVAGDAAAASPDSGGSLALP